MAYEGTSTNIVDGLNTAGQILAATSGESANRPSFPDVVVLLSDGGDNVNREQVGEHSVWVCVCVLCMGVRECVCTVCVV